MKLATSALKSTKFSPAAPNITGSLHSPGIKNPRISQNRPLGDARTRVSQPAVGEPSESDASTRHLPKIVYLFYGCHCLMHAWRLRPEKERCRRGRLGVHGRIFRSIEPPRRAVERPPKATTERGTRRGRRFARSSLKDSIPQLSCCKGWPQTYMSRYSFFENSH